jgi:lipopolysaccharide export system protein LptA
VSIRALKLGLLECGLTFALATVCGANQAPKILVTSFHDAQAGTDLQIAPAGQGLEAQLAAHIDSAAAGRAIAVLDADRHQEAILEANDIRQLAGDAGAAFVLVGEWRPAEGSSDRPHDFEAALELRSGHSGATEHRYRLAWDSTAGEAADVAMGRVAQEMLQDLEPSMEAMRMAQVDQDGAARSAPETKETKQNAKPRDRGKRTDFLTVTRDQPIEINAEQLELLTEGNSKHLIFSDEVLVVQGKMRLSAGELEAFYPDGASQPSRLHARKNVEVIEGNLEVHCLEVTYLRDEGLVICKGDALLVQGCDELRGEEIVFDLEEERIKISGAASVVLHLDRDDPDDCSSEETG